MLIPTRFLSVNRFTSKKTGQELTRFSAFDATGAVYSLFCNSDARLPENIQFLDRIDLNVEVTPRSDGGFSMNLRGIGNHQPAKIQF